MKYSKETKNQLKIKYFIENQPNTFKQLRWHRDNGRSVPICIVCNINQLKWIEDNNSYSLACSFKCRNKHPAWVKKYKDKSLEKYGTEHPSQNIDVQKNRIQNTDQNKKTAKFKQTNIKKYGVDNPMAVLDVKHKLANSNLKKYGVTNVFQSEKIKDKIKQTNMERYGVENVMYLDSTKEKIRDTNILKYGVEYPTQNTEIKEKIRQTNIQKYGYSSFSGKNYSDNLKQLLSNITNLEQELLNLTRLDFMNKYNICVKTYYAFIHQTNIKVNSVSLIEQTIINLFDEFDIITNSRSIIPPYEIDLYLPKFNLAIEINGTFWHSVDKDKHQSYHLNKTQLCKIKGIDLIHVWEHEWNAYSDFILTIIISALTKDYDRCYLDVFKGKLPYDLFSWFKPLNYVLMPPELLEFNEIKYWNTGYMDFNQYK